MTYEPEDRLGMTEAQWTTFQQYTHGFGEQDENGVDLSLLRENLKLTPTQRLQRLQKAQDLLVELRRAGNRLHPERHPRDRNLALLDAALGEPKTDFRQMLTVLDARGLPFVLTGATAMAAHGSAYLTEDLDLCVPSLTDPEVLRTLGEALFILQVRLWRVRDGMTYRWERQPGLASAAEPMAARTDAGILKVFAGDVPGVGPFQGVWDGAREMELFERRVRVMSLDHLIANKQALGRNHDQLHVMELKALRKLKQETEEP